MTVERKYHTRLCIVLRRDAVNQPRWEHDHVAWLRENILEAMKWCCRLQISRCGGRGVAKCSDSSGVRKMNRGATPDLSVECTANRSKWVVMKRHLARCPTKHTRPDSDVHLGVVSGACLGQILLASAPDCIFEHSEMIRITV
eukprot:CAMPEP_0204281272 /NCGR_PEP_ID=MMETSP0468-20130131/40462_1 /ASSEMBLY_ACC=CAM_ASM_000383 /TAXON_ID=2969 /ORGANISM="Oxyrrhis marina" /LENGTH=142 /DNA_ID=CAMNT_0051258605 /DNA_START=71 /DNA_END=499 /DNA_ORIENTATION=+